MSAELVEAKKRISTLESRTQSLEYKLAQLESVLAELNRNSSNEVTLETIVQTINNAINGPRGGATMYDQGDRMGCHQLYKDTARGLLREASAAQQQHFWYRILKKAIPLSEEGPDCRKWGQQCDGAWTMRFAFEAVKMGARSRSSVVEETEKGNTFWRRFTDRHKFCEMLV